jgi:PDZ domain-containing protein
MNDYLHIQLPLKNTSLRFDLIWVIVLPAGIWAVEHEYVAVLGAFLDPVRAWAVTGLIVLLVLLSLIFHTLAHILTARWMKLPLPQTLPVFPFGDTSQAWAVETRIGRAVLLSLAGPCASLILAGLAYLVWDAQINDTLNVSMPFLAFFNAWLAVCNLTPLYPLDGGRITEAVLSHWMANPIRRAKTHIWLRVLFLLILLVWGIFLFAQDSRFSLQTGGLTLSYALLLMTGLQNPLPASAGDHNDEIARRSLPVRIFLSSLLILALLAAPASLILTNNGLEAPGLALSVEPMVELPADLRHAHPGTFILTSVVSQSPIPVGLWLLGQLTPTVRILPPEPRQANRPSLQETARQGFQMLDTSETTALIVGIQLAGYSASLQGKGVQVNGILPESHTVDLLQIGDVITACDGSPIQVQSDLINRLQNKKAGDLIQLTIERNQARHEVQVQLLPPTAPGNPPRIGIVIETAGFEAVLPFPAKITPQKIVGGPSAGLMFTLTVYNLLQTQDLTGGRKIAGTGTINPDGSVGPIGGVEQKVVAAELAGAEYFFSPPDNYAAALSSAHHVKVVRVATAAEAIAFLRSLPPLPGE